MVLSEWFYQPSQEPNKVNTIPSEVKATNNFKPFKKSGYLQLSGCLAAILNSCNTPLSQSTKHAIKKLYSLLNKLHCRRISASTWVTPFQISIPC